MLEYAKFKAWGIKNVSVSWSLQCSPYAYCAHKMKNCCTQDPVTIHTLKAENTREFVTLPLTGIYVFNIKTWLASLLKQKENQFQRFIKLPVLQKPFWDPGKRDKHILTAASSELHPVSRGQSTTEQWKLSSQGHTWSWRQRLPQGEQVTKAIRVVSGRRAPPSLSKDMVHTQQEDA